MKKICLKALLLCCGFLLFNCQNDDPVAASKQDHFEISIERKNFKEFHDLPALVSKHIGEGVTGNLARSNNSDPLHDFEIDSTSVTQIIKEGKTYYTMAIYRAENIGNSFENLVISNDGAENTAHIVKYFPSQEYLQSLATNDHAPFIGEINITPLDYSQLTGRGIITCYSFTQAFCGNAPAGTAAGPGCYNHSDGGAHVQTRTVTFCIETTYQTQIIESPESPASGGGGSTGGGGGGIVTPPNTTPIVTEPVLLFAERQFVNGLSAEQKSWWNNAVNLSFKQLLISYMQNNNSSSESVVFVKWAIDYFRTHPSVTIAQFKNWFMGKSEGQDGQYNPYWENPNLSFPRQNLPTFENFQAAFPSDKDPRYDTPLKLLQSIGGEVMQFYSGEETNTCAFRLSKGLNYSGVTIPYIPNQTFKGADNKYYFKAAYQINKWMRKTFGTNDGDPTTPRNTNHYHFTGNQAGPNGINLPTILAGKAGIYSLYSSNFSWATGHADLIYETATCENECHFYDAPILYIDIWVLQ